MGTLQGLQLTKDIQKDSRLPECDMSAREYANRFGPYKVYLYLVGPAPEISDRGVEGVGATEKGG